MHAVINVNNKELVDLYYEDLENKLIQYLFVFLFIYYLCTYIHTYNINDKFTGCPANNAQQMVYRLLNFIIDDTLVPSILKLN